MQYRHCFIHEGLIKIDPKVDNGNLQILLQKNPKKSTSPLSIDALKLCADGFNKLLLFLDSSYEYLVEKIKIMDNPRYPSYFTSYPAGQKPV